MILGKVVGTVVTTISHRDYKNRRLLVVQPLIVEGEKPDEDFLAPGQHAGRHRRHRTGEPGGQRSTAGAE